MTENIKSMFLKTLETKKESPFFCRSHDGNFQVNFVSINSDDNDKLHYKLYYNVVSIYNGNELSFSSKGTFENCEEILAEIFSILWNYKMCPECFDLIPNDEKICSDCLPQKLFWDHGLDKGYTNSIPTCTICFDPVYGGKLQCGHHFHLTCFQKLYKKKSEIQCPNCRKNITVVDRKYFFMD